MKNSNPKTKSNSNHLLEITLGALTTVMVILIAVIAVVRNTQVATPTAEPEQGSLTSTMSFVYNAASSNLIEPELNKDYFADLGIVSTSDELSDLIVRYNDSDFDYREDFLTEFRGDFAKSNYLAIGSLNEYCEVDAIAYDGLEEKGDGVVVHLTYSTGCGPCTIGGELLLIEVPKSVSDSSQVSYKVASNHKECNQHKVLKPIVYLYPETEMQLEVILGSPERVTVSYPSYDAGWRVLARPDGTLTDLASGRELYALYWEGLRSFETDFSSGFVVKGEDSAEFLEEKLALLGLSPKEAEEFIVYWLPKLHGSEYNLIRFEDLDVIEKDMPLAFSSNGSVVEPDTLIRVWMSFKPLSAYVEVPEQELTQVASRHGFTVVEWGGSEVKN